MEANNLYDYAISKIFKLVDSNGLILKNLNKYNKNSSKGCVLEVNLEYPKELHKLNNDYPLDPNKIEIKPRPQRILPA